MRRLKTLHKLKHTTTTFTYLPCSAFVVNNNSYYFFNSFTTSPIYNQTKLYSTGTSRVKRRKTKPEKSDDHIHYIEPAGIVYAMSTAQSYNLKRLREHLEALKLSGVKVRTTIGGSKECLVIEKKRDNVDKAWMFFLYFGVYVRWGRWTQEELDSIKIVRKDYGEEVSEFIGEDQEESFNYYFKAKASKSSLDQRLNKLADGDVEDILQISENTDSENTINQMLAISYAMAQSAKLNKGEVALAPLQSDADDSKLKTSNQVYSTIKKLQSRKSSIFGGHVDFISKSTSIFWDRPQLESLWLSVAANLAVFNRAQVLATQLNIVDEKLKTHGDILNTKASHRSEIAIIALIVTEVLFLLWEHGPDLLSKIFSIFD